MAAFQRDPPSLEARGPGPGIGKATDVRPVPRAGTRVNPVRPDAVWSSSGTKRDHDAEGWPTTFRVIVLGLSKATRSVAWQRLQRIPWPASSRLTPRRSLQTGQETWPGAPRETIPRNDRATDRAADAAGISARI